MKTEHYRGYDIMADGYLGDTKFFFEIKKDDKTVYSTLWNDDKGWNSYQHAISTAKKHIDEALDNPVNGNYYFDERGFLRFNVDNYLKNDKA